MKKLFVLFWLINLLFLTGNELHSQLYTNYVAARHQFKLLGGTYKKAYDLSHQGKNDEFISLMNQLIDSLEKAEDWERYLLAQDEIATFYFQQNNPSKSLEILQETERKCKTYVDTLSCEYVYFYKFYWFSYRYLNDLKNLKIIADKRYNTVEHRTKHDLIKPREHALDLDTYDEISGTYEKLSEFEKQYECIEKSFEIGELVNWQYRINFLYGQLGGYLYIDGYTDYGFDFVLKSYNSNKLRTYYDSVMVRGDMSILSRVYIKKGKYQESLKITNKLERIILDSPEPEMGWLAISYLLKSNVFEKMEMYDSTELYLNKALESIAQTQRNSLKIEAYMKFAQLYAEHKNNIDTAYYFISKADSILANNDIIDREIIEKYFLFLNNFYKSQNKPEKALELVHSGLCQLADTVADNAFEIIDFPVNKLKLETLALFEAKINGLIDHFTVEKNENELQIIYDHFNALNKYFLIVLSENTNKNLIEEILKRYRAIIDNVVNFYNQHDVLSREEEKKLYSVISKGKGLELFIEKYQVEFNKLANSKDTPINIIENKNKILELENQIELIDKDTYADSVKKLEDKLIVLKRKTFIAEIQLKYRLHSKMNLHQALEVDIKEIQKKLASNTVFVEYHITEKFINSIVISESDFQIHKKAFGDLGVLIDECYKNKKTSNNNTEVSIKLYNSLIAPIEKEISGKKNLVFVLDKSLHQIPFEILGHKANRLINNYAIRYSYSSNLWIDTKTKNKSLEHEVFAVAPVFDFDMNLVSMNSGFRNAFEDDTTIFRSGYTFRPLPYTIDEVNEIEWIFHKNKKGFSQLVNQQATKEAFIKEFKTADILHIATHGLVNKKNHYLSGLALFPKNTEYTQNDIFYHYELYNYELNADLVVLSACKTGTGKIMEGEGVMALTRGFIYAGVPNVIASLWKVHDKKTKELMVAFYTHLLEDKVSYAEALRLAKLDCIKKGFLPLDWAGFVLIEG